MLYERKGFTKLPCARCGELTEFRDEYDMPICFWHAMDDAEDACDYPVDEYDFTSDSE